MLLDHSPTHAEAAHSTHIVDFYKDPRKLARQVVDFMAPALVKGEGCLLIATSKHLGLFRQALHQSGFAVSALENSGRLKCLEAGKILNEFYREGTLSWARFEAQAGAELRKLAIRYKKVRAYGEMVNLLWQRKEYLRALELERFWNRLGLQHPLALLCAYSLDLTDPAIDAKAVASICQTHTHTYTRIPLASSISLA